MVKSDLAKKWENLTDKFLMPISWEDALNNLENDAEENGYNGENSWLSKVDSKTPIYGQYLNSSLYGEDSFHNLGFHHLIDELQNSVNPESDLPDHLKLRHESLARMSVPQAVQHVHNINEWRRKNREEANKEKAFNSATFLHKDYPDSNYAWHELRLPE